MFRAYSPSYVYCPPIKVPSFDDTKVIWPSTHSVPLLTVKADRFCCFCGQYSVFPPGDFRTFSMSSSIINLFLIALVTCLPNLLFAEEDLSIPREEQHAIFQGAENMLAEAIINHFEQEQLANNTSQEAVEFLAEEVTDDVKATSALKSTSQPRLTCNSGYTLCKNGTTATCCDNMDESCKKPTGDIAYCAPKDGFDCGDGKFLCEKGKSNVCCPNGSGCKSFMGYAYCHLPEDHCKANENACRGSSGAVLDCCNNETETCKSLGHGFKGCTANSCGENETLCEGSKLSICCDNETSVCSASSKGAAHCVPLDSQ